MSFFGKLDDEMENSSEGQSSHLQGENSTLGRKEEIPRGSGSVRLKIPPQSWFQVGVRGPSCAAHPTREASCPHQG